MTRHGPIVVGVDGSEDGLRAVRYSASVAQRQGRSIRIVHAFHLSAGLNPMLPLYGIDSLRECGVNALDAAEAKLALLAPDVAIERHLVTTSAEHALVSESRTAAAVVVGRRDLHGVNRLLSGSTSTAVAARAKCPVLVVPSGWPGPHPEHQVVVGVDGSPAGRDAVAYAFETASELNVPLMAVRAWEVPTRWYTDIRYANNEVAAWLKEEERAFAEELAGYCETYPDVPVSQVFERSVSPAEALTRRASEAALLVIGGRGLGGVPGLDLGWTTRSVLAHAHCPIAVVHSHDDVHDHVLAAAVEATTS